MTKPEIIRVLDAKNEDDRKYAQENLIGCWVGHDMNAWGAEYPQCKTLKKVLMDEFHLWTRSDYSCSQYICEFSNSRPKNMSQNNNENDKTLCNKCNGVVVDCWGSRLDIQYRENVYCQACYEKALNSSITLKSNNCMKCSSLIVPTEAYCETCYDDQQPPFYCAANIDQVPDDAVGKEWEFLKDNEWVKYCLGNIEKNSEDGVFVFHAVDLNEEDYYFAFMRPIQQKPVKRMSVDEAQQALIDKLNKENCRLVTVNFCHEGRFMFIAECIDWTYEKAYTKGSVQKELNCEVITNDERW